MVRSACKPFIYLLRERERERVGGWEKKKKTVCDFHGTRERSVTSFKPGNIEWGWSLWRRFWSLKRTAWNCFSLWCFLLDPFIRAFYFDSACIIGWGWRKKGRCPAKWSHRDARARGKGGREVGTLQSEISVTLEQEGTREERSTQQVKSAWR